MKVNSVDEAFGIKSPALVSRIAGGLGNQLFCSDYPRWFREKTADRDDCIAVDVNDTQDGAIEDLRLMRACRHFINGNRVFSWWIAWLGEQTDSIVFSPPNDELSNRYSYNRGLIPDRWNVLSWS